MQAGERASGAACTAVSSSLGSLARSGVWRWLACGSWAVPLSVHATWDSSLASKTYLLLASMHFVMSCFTWFAGEILGLANAPWCESRACEWLMGSGAKAQGSVMTSLKDKPGVKWGSLMKGGAEFKDSAASRWGAEYTLSDHIVHTNECAHGYVGKPDLTLGVRW